MRVSLNLIKKYVDLPKDIKYEDMAHELTLKTVEVESVENIKEKFHDIVVGKILEVKSHPNADALRICIVDIGENEPVQIVCGGSNLYEGELVVISKPGAVVVWHGEGEPVVIKQTKMRGEDSYGMICGAEEVFLKEFFPPKDEKEIVDLKGIDCKPGDNIADVLGLDDTIIEIDNKSLTNRPDLWGHYGIARELATIYDVKLNPLEKKEIDKKVPEYNVVIEDTNKCNRYIGLEMDNVYDKPSPMWMQSYLVNCGMRPINAIVDITNYVMIVTGQPMHAFDRTHVEGEKIVVRNAKEGESLLLLDDTTVDLNTDDLVICDTKEPMALAGIRGGKKDSILPETTGIVFEIASFIDKTIRKSSKKFSEKTDASIRYEKNIDTYRCDDALGLTLKLMEEIFPESNIVKYKDNYVNKTEKSCISIEEEFLNNRLGEVIPKEKINQILTGLGYEVEFKDGVYNVKAPVYRSTGDVSLKDDVLGDIARIIGYDNFEAKPLTIKIDHPVIQADYLLKRRIKEYLANRCGFTEIYTYPWIDEKYIKASKIDYTNAVRLATPPAPELASLRMSLVPGMLEAISKNLRYYDEFKIFEMTQVFEKGEYHESSEDETLPIHTEKLSGAIVGKDARNLFFELKGVIENMSAYTHMENLTLVKEEKPSYADINAYLSIKLGDEEIGNISLVSVGTMMDAKIKRANVAIFELNADKLIPFTSRTNKYVAAPLLPEIEKDLAVIVDKTVSWKEIEETVRGMVNKVEFVDEFTGNQIPDDKKSITFKIKLISENETMTSDEINSKMSAILKKLEKRLNAYLREE